MHDYYYLCNKYLSVLQLVRREAFYNKINESDLQHLGSTLFK